MREMPVLTAVTLINIILHANEGWFHLLKISLRNKSHLKRRQPGREKLKILIIPRCIKMVNFT